MERSRAAALLLTVFAVAVVGLAASTLPAAQSDAVQSRDSAASRSGSPSGGGVASSSQRPDNLVLPSLDAANELESDSTGDGTTLGRLVVGVALFLVGAFLVVVRLTGDDARAPPDADDPPSPTVPASSPDAPRGVSGPPPTNDVYRAWRALASAGPARRRSQETPGEFARRAVESGLPDAPVGRLTELFRSVRYGDAPPTADRERRALDALDRIPQVDPPSEAESDR
jgi:hypothetical protein